MAEPENQTAHDQDQGMIPVVNAQGAPRSARATKSTSPPKPSRATKTESAVKPKDEKTEAAESAETTTTEAGKPMQSTSKNDRRRNRTSVTIPLDSAVVDVAVKAASLPVTAVKKVAQNKNGIPAYAAVGGLAVLGAVEWPVAAVGGLGLAALRRWGPLKPAQNPAPIEKK